MKLSRRHLLAASPALLFSPSASHAAPRALDKRDMIIHSTRPEDYEMTLDGFRSAITPLERFYVRSHHYTPKVDAATWRLKIGGAVDAAREFSLDELKKLPAASVVSVAECAGNGRALYKPGMPGLQWTYGGVGCAEWRGVRLADVLRAARMKTSAQNIVFDGVDQAIGTMPKFQRSIPVARALHPDTILAYEMNGEALPYAHGFPLRVVVPGWSGDCWIKWLQGIDVLEKEFDGFFMKTGYRHPGRGMKPGWKPEPAMMKPVEEIRVKSVIASPLAGETVSGASIPVTITAWSGMSAVRSVEVSADSGRTWLPAKRVESKGKYGFEIWSFDWKPAQTGWNRLMARARDMAGNTQPFAQEWNPSGYLWNVVHSIEVEVGATAAPAPAETVSTNDVPAPSHYQTSCIGCHDERITATQRLTRAQWEAEVDKMVRWGASVKPENKVELLDFLARKWPVR
jgi:sulfite oxidase